MNEQVEFERRWPSLQETLRAYEKQQEENPPELDYRCGDCGERIDDLNCSRTEIIPRSGERQTDFLCRRCAR